MIDNRVVRVAADDSRAPELTRALVDAGVDVHEIRQSERSLEEVFFEMTGTSSNHQHEVRTLETLEVSR